MSGIDDFRKSAQASSRDVDQLLNEFAPDPSHRSSPSQEGTAFPSDRPATEAPSGSSGGDMMGHAKERGHEIAGTAKEKADDLAATAQAKADEGLDAAASGLGQAADKLREQGNQHQGTAGTAATRAADVLENASGYLRDKDTEQLLTDLEGLVRRKPTESLLAAAGIGFVLSKLLR